MSAGGFHRNMMRMVADAARARGEWVQPKSAEGYRLRARWYYWHSKECHPTSDALPTAKRMYAMCRDIEAKQDAGARMEVSRRALRPGGGA